MFSSEKVREKLGSDASDIMLLLQAGDGGTQKSVLFPTRCKSNATISLCSICYMYETVNP